MKRLAVIASLFISVQAPAAEGFPLQRLPLGARSAALAGAQTAQAGRAEALAANPAVAAMVPGVELSLGHMVWLEETQFSSLAALLPLGAWGGLGLSGHFASAQDTRRDAFGAVQGNFGVDGQALQLSLGVRAGQLGFGASAKYLRQAVSGQAAEAVAGDAGLLLSLWRGQLSLGLAGQNIGATLESARSNSPLQSPQQWRAGMVLKGPLGLSAFSDFVHQPLSSSDAVLAGLEWRMQAGAGKLALRGGYDSALQAGGLSGLSVGLGLGWGKWSLDYAWLPMGDLGLSQRASLSWGPQPAVLAPTAASAAPAIYTERVRQLNREGTRLFKEGKLADALAQYQTAELLEPDNAKVQYNLGGVYWAQEQRAEAEKHFRRSLQLKPDQAPLRQWMLDQGLAP